MGPGAREGVPDALPTVEPRREIGNVKQDRRGSPVAGSGPWGRGQYPRTQTTGTNMRVRGRGDAGTLSRSLKLNSSEIQEDR